MPFTADKMQDIFSENASQWDNLANFFTLGLNTFWKHDLSTILNELHPKSILELGAGTGILTRDLALSMPSITIYAMDISEPYLAIAKNKMQENNISNVKFIHGDAQTPQAYLPKGFQTDLILSSYLAKYLDNSLWVKNVTPLLAKNGQIVVHEATYPTDPVGQFVYNNHIRMFSSILSVNAEWSELGHELQNIFLNNNWKPQLTEALHKHGYAIKIQTTPFGMSSIIDARKL